MNLYFFTPLSMSPEKKTLLKRLSFRFLRGFFSSFVGAMSLLSQSGDYSSAALTSVAIASITGGLAVVDKYIRTY